MSQENQGSDWLGKTCKDVTLNDGYFIFLMYRCMVPDEMEQFAVAVSLGW